MLRMRDRSQVEPEGRLRRSGFVGGLKGARVLPDLPTAVLARLRGHVGGSYPEPLRGIAAELGYHPLQSATEEELAAIQEEMDRITRNG